MTSRRDFMLAAPLSAAAFSIAGASGLTFGTQLAKADELTTQGNPARDLVTRRAIEAMIWGMPAVNLDLMYQAMIRETPARANQMLYWSRLLDWKNQTLTPNTDVIYLTPYFDTKEAGPMVLEIPPADDGVINGTIMDAWQMPLEDVGPAGVDGGKGGKYLILPPDHKGEVPDGYIALPSLTWKGYALLRSILRGGSEADAAKAVEYGKRINLYPLSQAASPPQTTYVDGDGVLYDATIPYDARFFELLNGVVQSEPWLERDRAMIDTLRTIGIEKGKHFAPDAEMRKALDAAASDGHVLLDGWFKKLFEARWVDSSRWAFPAAPSFVEAVQSHYANPDVYPLDDRGLLFTYIFFTPKRLGEGQFYLMVIDDKNGAAFDGTKIYRLNVPTNPPVRQYWSATIYDRKTHALLREMSHAGRSSQMLAWRSIQTVRWTSISGRRLRPARRRTGRRPVVVKASRFCSASTVLCRRCSTRPGCCRMSRK